MGRTEKPLRRYRAYLVVFLSTLAVWIGTAMSESTTLRTSVNIEWTGFDTARYAVERADTVVAVDIHANGWQLLRLNFSRRRQATLDVATRQPHVAADGRTTIGVGAYELASLCSQRLGYASPQQVAVVADTVRLLLAAREKKGYVPRLDNVSYTFASRCGLAGAPRLKPDSVYLYGSAATLAAIDHLDAEAYTIANIDHSDDYRIELQPVWEKYNDVWISDPYVLLYIPVEQYTLVTQTLPVRLRNADSTDVVRLYPTEVEVSYFVSSTDRGRDVAHKLEASVDFAQAGPSETLPVAVSFPQSVRIRNVSPDHVRYVVIK
ncbi:MAG: hypothetical protein IJ684_04745 [Bacteroidales bacterium]|nr:hypothetical protein [Bacteroidales bacterium]